MKTYFEFLNDDLSEEIINHLNKTIDYLKDKKQILLITTSNRSEESDETPKSSLLAEIIHSHYKSNSKIIDLNKINFETCEGHVSNKTGNICGVKEALLKDPSKNSNGLLRCWASLEEKDELYKITTELFNSDCVIFFVSIRWGHSNSQYQKLVERLSWIYYRTATLKENNIVKDIDSGFIAIGHNWNGEAEVKTQKYILESIGFKVPNELFWNREFVQTNEKESLKSYIDDAKDFYSMIEIIE